MGFQCLPGDPECFGFILKTSEPECFGFILKTSESDGPPHGGIAPGIDPPLRRLPREAEALIEGMP
jgi:aspartyl-tRNA synthetase